MFLKSHLRLKSTRTVNGLPSKVFFRVYPNFADSVSAHTQLFLYGTTWNAKQYASVLSATDYKTAAKAVQSSGYATDPTYADKLINMIETYHLNQYDKSSTI